MLFSSMIFLWVFLPAVLVINFLFSVIPFKSDMARNRAKNTFLLIASFIFYAWGGIYYLLIMISSILLNFFGGYYADKFREDRRKKKTVLILTVVFNLAILFFFKYFNMLIDIIESLMLSSKGFGTVWSSLIGLEGTGALGIKEIVLPIGISFFTFQAMSYVLDVYSGKAHVQKNIFDFALYVSLFPQLVAGPIVKYSDIESQLLTRREGIDLFLSGQRRFCYGLGKKVVISNVLAKVADDIWALETKDLGAAVAWLGIIAYTLQIYYDFSGYSDMAIGIGRMLGFQFKENFDYPYTSLSVQDFWRRWHISLSSWFKEYVYIPLGGNRCGAVRTYINLCIVFLLTGIWHGANFTFIAWGVMYGILLIIERLFLGKLLKKNPVKIVNWIYTMFAVMIAWIYFRSEDIFQAHEYIGQLFNFNANRYSPVSHLSMQVIIVIVFAILFSGFVQRPVKALVARITEKRNIPVALTYAVKGADLAVQILALVLSIMSLISGTHNAFIYFQF